MPEGAAFRDSRQFLGEVYNPDLVAALIGMRKHEYLKYFDEGPVKNKWSRSWDTSKHLPSAKGDSVLKKFEVEMKCNLRPNTDCRAVDRIAMNHATNPTGRAWSVYCFGK